MVPMTTSKLRTASAAFAAALALASVGQAAVSDAHAKMQAPQIQAAQGWWCTTLNNGYDGTPGFDFQVDGHASTGATANDYVGVGLMSGCPTWTW